MEVKLENGNFVITIAKSAPRASKSGKTNIVASTGGFQKAIIDGKEYSVSINITERK